MRSTFALAVLASALAASGCGSGGQDNAPVTLTIFGTPEHTGAVSNTGTVSFLSLYAGDTGDPLAMFSLGQSVRVFASFDISAIPPGAVVTSATLTLSARLVDATPFATLGAILVDQVVYGNVLEAGAYARSFPVNQGFTTLASDPALGPKSATVTVAVQDDLASPRTQSQFRLRFAVEDDLDADGDAMIFWTTAAAPLPSDSPTLVVTYQP